MNVGRVDDNALQYIFNFKMKDKLKILHEDAIQGNMRAVYLPSLTDFGLCLFLKHLFVYIFIKIILFIFFQAYYDSLKFPESLVLCSVKERHMQVK